MSVGFRDTSAPHAQNSPCLLTVQPTHLKTRARLLFPIVLSRQFQYEHVEVGESDQVVRRNLRMMPLNEYVISKPKRSFLTQAATSGLRSSSKASPASDPHRLKQPGYLGHHSVSIIFSGRGFHPLFRERQT